MLERASLFLLGGGAYAALELAWRGTTHWTMFLTGGVCLCLLQKRQETVGKRCGKIRFIA